MIGYRLLDIDTNSAGKGSIMGKMKVIGIVVAAVFGGLLAYQLWIAISNWGYFSELNNPLFWSYDPALQVEIIAGATHAMNSALLAIPCGILMMVGVLLAMRRK